MIAKPTAEDRKLDLNSILHRLWLYKGMENELAESIIRRAHHAESQLADLKAEGERLRAGIVEIRDNCGCAEDNSQCANCDRCDRLLGQEPTT